ncbi:hypothetical protein UU7_07566 [Rhodanobacter spathiphylli B39]|uniref:Uncharacterized protein n=1 Tax=Rhodanobacter spathiphylli B39 TaxID=1163407 RepID=I4W2J2_9GAMM|nr:hypothetical protein UU7_07566 [Rhodanobacter spathiphylli B39]
MANRVYQWVHDEGLKSEDVAVLVAIRPKSLAYELLVLRMAALGVECVIECHGKGKCVLIDTVSRFKGLEVQAAVLWLGDEVIDEAQWEVAYVGATRAKSLLNIVGTMKVVKALRSRAQ